MTTATVGLLSTLISGPVTEPRAVWPGTVGHKAAMGSCDVAGGYQPGLDAAAKLHRELEELQEGWLILVGRSSFQSSQTPPLSTFHKLTLL